jgi:Flp pilus assembly CpaE family ATPase
VDAADRVLVVTAPDVVALSAARSTLDRLEVPRKGEPSAPGAERVEVLLVRHVRRRHPDAAEVAVELNAPVAGVVPDDDRVDAAAASQRQRALAALPGRWRSPAARAFADLAARLRHASTYRERVEEVA